MKILLFDMDGVLLEPIGYHMALKETVRLVSQSLGFENFILSDQDIAQFEALGISNEWHSSALCAALFNIIASKPLLNIRPALDRLFIAIAQHPADEPAILRAQKATASLAKQYDVAPNQAVEIMQTSESISHSFTLNIFQELVLGSKIFAKTYQRQPQLTVESYLQQYDVPQISSAVLNKLTNWLTDPHHYAAILTNRPSAIMLGKAGTPEAELGAQLIGLSGLPIVGSGEIHWLAQEMNVNVETLLKPAPTHALAAVFAALGIPLEDSLKNSFSWIVSNHSIDTRVIPKSEVYVFEDTTAGIISVENMQRVLAQKNIHINTHKIGISSNLIKISNLKDQGALIYNSINDALSEII